MYSKATHSASTAPAPSSTPNGQNNWAADTPGPASFDLRSDVVTTPTANMLHAISQCTLLDDVFLEDPTTTSLESFIASLTGHPAALLVLSGTMGNQVALRTHLQGPPHSVLCDHRAHILEWEAGGVASLCGALVKGVVPRNGHHLTLEDVVKHAVVSDDVHACPTRVISLENTLGGTVLPLEECRRIAAWARERGIMMHLDGARLWEAVVAGAGKLEEYCECFDSVSLCFSKGLGAPIGSIIVGSEAFIKRSRWIRKSIGGGLRQAGVVSAAARVGVEETFLGGRLEQSHKNAKKVAKMWQDLGGKLQYPVETNMVWLDIEDAGIEEDRLIEAAEKAGLRMMGGRLVVHYQVCDEALQRLEGLMREALGKGDPNGVSNGEVTIPAEDMKVNVE
ncbi:hypothetical protein H2201_000674 [Coniosporium apollinis]|uniref:Aromatic amino acid beta-eliminating lyase/threonine aldolase domain-containing protein n=1 Tax=Coniosporium apollinis TaxID=61459 RepID=A0ABQ9PAC6_9PEZI|nr:hypothetical protein H2201_000674 [Coniosporium apollinis]